jgi:putative glutathione S-transferase
MNTQIKGSERSLVFEGVNHGAGIDGYSVSRTWFFVWWLTQSRSMIGRRLVEEYEVGLLMDGIWHDQWYDTKSTDGAFIRSDAQFRNWVTADGAAGPSGEAGFKAEKDRYHLYVSHACPWANRAMIFRAIKGLEDVISISVVNWVMRAKGWTFEPGPGVISDPISQADYLSDVYVHAKRDYSGRVTVPMLWDKERETIVSNESSEIIRMMNCAFDDIGALPGDYYPESLRDEIDEINHRVYNTVNNGVYKSGFATTQRAYEEAVVALFETLDWLEEKLSRKRYLAGSLITEADWRLFPTLVRFDAVYVGHFKCNLKRIVDYPNLWAYTRELYQYPGVSDTIHMDHIKGHYYQSHETLNPQSIVPSGPIIDFRSPHDRGFMGGGDYGGSH